METIQEHLCKCINCDTLFMDENPQIGAELYPLYQDDNGLWRTKYDIESPYTIHTVYADTPVLEGEIFEDGEESFFGCDQCKTDEYLIDL